MNLKEELQDSKYIDKTDAECRIRLKDKNILVKQNIYVLDIQNYLNMVDKLIEFEDSTSFACRKAKRTFELNLFIKMTDSSIAAKFTAELNNLVDNESVSINIADKDYILSLGEKLISRVEEIGIRVPLIGHITEARGT